MIVIDHAAVSQNRDLLMNRHAPDEIDYRDERKKEERGVTFEDFAKIPVLPRRSPWNTENEDVEAAKPDKIKPVQLFIESLRAFAQFRYDRRFR